MSLLRSFLSLAPRFTFTRPFATSSALCGEKIPVKKTSTKKDAASPTVAALSVEVAKLVGKTGDKDKVPASSSSPRKKQRAPTPKVDWQMDKTIPRTSVLSHQPIPDHHWQDWRMLRDVKRRGYLNRDGRVRKMLRCVLRTDVLPTEISEEAERDILKLPRDSNYGRIVDRCMITSRRRGLVRHWRLSRIVWRHYADYNRLSGVMRAKWGNRNNPVYWHNIDPDLHGTLRAIDPVYGADLNKEYWARENYQFRSVRPPMEYNQSIYKKPFKYPAPTR